MTPDDLLALLTPAERQELDDIYELAWEARRILEEVLLRMTPLPPRIITTSTTSTTETLP
jgi:hypothetical protein